MPKKFLIIRLSSLGDVLISTSAVQYLSRQGDFEIHFLVRREFKDLITGNPLIKKIHILDRKEGLQGLRLLKKNIQSENYDCIFDLQNNLKSRYLSGSFHSERFSKRTLSRFLYVNFRIGSYAKQILSVPDRYLNTIDQFFYHSRQEHQTEDLKPLLILDEKTDKKGRDVWKQNKDFHYLMAPGARHYTKRWPEDYYAELIKILYERTGKKTLLVGGPDEITTCESIIKQSISRKVQTALSLAGSISLLETAAVIKHASVFVSNDSGLMHVASAFSIPQIAIFGSTTEHLGFFPQNKKAIIAEQKLSCRPCTHVGRANCPRKHFQCMKEIKPDAIADIMQRLT